MAGTLADLLPNWYKALGGNPQEVRVVLINHGEQILEGDINSHLREIAEDELQKRAVPVELILRAKATAIRPDAVNYDRDGKQETLPASTAIWTAGTTTHPVIKNLPIPDNRRDKHHRLLVTPTLQLLDYPEVFAGGDCAGIEGNSLPPTAQVAYQQGAAIARNLKAMALGQELQPADVNLRGTLLKIGIGNSVANIFNRLQVSGKIGHLIRQGTYLELLPAPIHDLQVTVDWLPDEIFDRHLGGGEGIEQAVKIAGAVGAVVVGAIVAKKMLDVMAEEEPQQPSQQELPEGELSMSEG